MGEIEIKDFVFRNKKEDKPKGMYDLSLTPLEYNKVVDESGYGNEYVRYIVQLYNKSRYGNKVITKDELDKSHKLRNEG